MHIPKSYKIKICDILWEPLTSESYFHWKINKCLLPMHMQIIGNARIQGDRLEISCIRLGNAPIVVTSKLQPTIVRSPAKAKYGITLGKATHI